MGIGESLEGIQFEIPDLASALQLTLRLCRDWEVSLKDNPDVNVVSVLLRPDSDDLAVLLRNVEAWVVEGSLCAIRFAVDGREYVLAAGGPDWTETPGESRLKPGSGPNVFRQAPLRSLRTGCAPSSKPSGALERRLANFRLAR